MMSPRAAIFVAFAACASGAPREGELPTPEPADTPAVPQPLQNETPKTKGNKTKGKAPPPPPQAAQSDACPAGMVLIDGSYCDKVEHKCLIEWYAPQNNKRVCEQFEPKATCVGSRSHKRYCIDKFEWPNQQGVRPEVMNTFYQAQVKCAALGRRMCTESEWDFACEGPDMKPFPHGFTRDPHKCNGDHDWDNPDMKNVGDRDPTELARLWRGVPSGSQPECVSDFGVHDMPANADEVVAGETARAKFSSVNTGGPWYSGVRNQCRPKVYTHEEGFYYYYLGFRCCAAADGKSNDPRTPKQIRERMKWQNVERLAGFTVEHMKKVLEHKKAGTCNCVDNKLPGVDLPRNPKWLCKTLCGTLLGPGAKDGTDKTRVLNKSRSKIDKK
ncbi:MAG TPA: SUMF1/EgtB/PvdO family nonheme iron enzyme [Polyangiaceae bacterium]|jgi:hypothetical protein|nr:SUMF1/EgtB/PvdO family nonheme iron enzyme [Polyangiaceae bacterium]